MEVLILALHEQARAESRLYSLSALVMLPLATGITLSVHAVVITANRSFDDQAEGLEGYGYLFSFEWPSVVYALDILTWDWFFGLSMLLGAMIVCIIISLFVSMLAITVWQIV